MTDELPGVAAAAASGLDFRVVSTDPPTSAEESAVLQGIELGQLIRTIAVRRSSGDYLFVLVPGGRQIDWPRLRAHLGVSRLSLPEEAEAKEATGYARGAITPFGSAGALPVVADETVAAAGVVAIGAGARGVNIHLAAADLLRALDADLADVTRPAG